LELSLPSEKYFKFLTGKLELIKGRLSSLNELYKADVISRSVYEIVSRRVKAEIRFVGKILRSLVDMAGRRISEFEEAIRLLEAHLARIEIDYASGRLNEEEYKRNCEIIRSGINLLRDRLEKIRSLIMEVSPEILKPKFSKEAAEKILRELPMERAFYFYTDYNQYTGIYARSLEEFAKVLKDVNPKSVRFHLIRGDFQVWIKDLGDFEFADRLNGLRWLNVDDEALRDIIADHVMKRVQKLKEILSQ